MNLGDFREVVKGAAAIRGTARLQPVGGKGDKVFPPTHMVDDKRRDNVKGSRYARETRRIDGAVRPVVLLDSVQSQANRMEEALDGLWRTKQVSLPVVEVKLGLAELPSVTSLTAPHRIADALLRDSLLDGKLFRFSELGKSFTDASIHNAAPLFKVCPTALLFGVWDSSGPKGGLGFKLARNLTSEIIGVDAEYGVKTSSRIDPTNISKNSGVLYESTNPEEAFTLDEKKAKKKDGKPVLFRKDGKPSSANLGNIPPTLDELGGGVTFEYAQQTVVLSLSGIRRLGFGDAGTNDAGHTTLAALGVLAVQASQDRGYDFRSRCQLCPEPGKGLALEVVNKDGTVRSLEVTFDAALALFNESVATLPKALAWGLLPGKPLAELVPTERLMALLAKTRELAQAGDSEAEA